MGSKKRSSDSVDTVDESKAYSEHLEKKMKKIKKTDGEIDKVKTNTDSETPMERKKKRKALDKEKKNKSVVSDENGEVKVNVGNVEVENRISIMPEFHIGVFKDLGNKEVEVREAAAERLVSELIEVQKAYDLMERKDEIDGGGLKLEAEKDDGLNNCAPSVRYAVRRLIRGVSSSRECARQGFALGLTMLVGAVSNIAIDSLLKLIVDLLEVSSSMKGQEIKDCLLGRLFAYGALARSGRLEQSLSDSELVKEFTSSVISLAAKKRYLQEPAVVVILQLSEKERNCGMSADANRLHALRYLLIQLLLQLLLRPGEFSEATSEIIICCKKFFPSPDLLDSDDEPNGDEEPELMDVFVDTMLSLLPQSSAPMRSAIEQVIKKDLKPARRQETDNIEEAEDSDEAETGDNTGDGDEQSEDSEGTVVKESREENSDDDSDGGMDDEAMFRMDSYLAQIFKEKRNQAGGGDTADSQLVLFKLRVLSLLEIYLHENQGKPQVLKVYSNLCQAFVNPHTTEGSEQLGDRICKIVENKILKAKHYPKGESLQLSMLEPLLEKNLKLAAKPFKKKKAAITPSKKKQSASFQRYRKIVNLAQNSTYWILKIIDSGSFSEEDKEKVFDILKSAIVAYFDGKNSQLKPQFLKEIIRRCAWVGERYFGLLVEKCSTAKSKFRQVEALDLLLEALKPFVSVNKSEGTVVPGKKMLSSHLSELCVLIKELVTNMPEKQARRAEVRRFCVRMFHIISNLKLSTKFLKSLDSEVHSVCEKQIGKAFLDLKKQE
uniref:Myb-binding protein 1A n=1 Tax=Tanacetum cinerariifolium TaxID=118510 RepID=A0A6L2JVC1_TANCI|nr:myb-binding protein 1A [Tanacetum cinerariifolium]